MLRPIDYQVWFWHEDTFRVRSTGRSFWNPGGWFPAVKAQPIFELPEGHPWLALPTLSLKLPTTIDPDGDGECVRDVTFKRGDGESFAADESLVFADEGEEIERLIVQAAIAAAKGVARARDTEADELRSGAA